MSPNPNASKSVPTEGDDAAAALLDEMMFEGEEGGIDEGARGLARQQMASACSQQQQQQQVPAGRTVDNMLALQRAEEDRALRRDAGPAKAITSVPEEAEALVDWFAERCAGSQPPARPCARLTGLNPKSATPKPQNQVADDLHPLLVPPNI
jgi:hypothetical protein